MGMMLLQEDTTVTWDPEYGCYCSGSISDGTGWVILFLFLFTFALYLCWFPLRWIARWQAARYVLPTVMLLVALAEPGSALNAPAVIGAGVVSLAFQDLGMPGWLLPALTAILAWMSWFIAVLCIEPAMSAEQ